MCLYTKETKLKTAKEDIVCYKVLLNDFSSNVLYTPYLYKIIRWADILLHNPIKAEGWVRKRRLFQDAPISFNCGLIHTFQNIEAAKDSFLGVIINRYKIFQCIIPKGTKYIDGKDDNGRCTYASKLIIPQQQIK
jgi:hypothetical protein